MFGRRTLPPAPPNAGAAARRLNYVKQAAFSPAEFLRTVWLLVGSRAMRPIAGYRFTGGRSCRIFAKWDSIAVLTYLAKILTRIQGGRTANFVCCGIFLCRLARSVANMAGGRAISS
jgi:hypothetical protein